MIQSHEFYMRLAIEEAEESVKSGSYPFAAVVVDGNGEVVAKDHDRVKELMDPTAHGEVNAIRKLCRELNTLSLENFTFYTTSEPCPTCLTSMIKAKVSRVVYGCKTEISASAPISAEFIASKSNNKIIVMGGVLEKNA
jgi:tRNA(Arg) A34 adenosine deaminase TadA